MGIKNAMPADRDVFEYYVKTVQRLLPGAQWCGAGVGKFQLSLNKWSIQLGGHTGTGLEDNIRISKKQLASSNAELVRLVVNLCKQYERPIATSSRTREILGLQLCLLHKV